VIPSIDAFLNNTQPEYITLDVELWPAPLATARDMGLDDEWCKQLEQREHQLLVVRRIVAKSDAQKKLLAGDLILTINGTLVNRFIEVEQVLNSKKSENDNDEVEVQFFRSGQVLKTTVCTKLLSGPQMKASIGPDCLVLWCGAFLHKHHRAVLERGFIPEGTETGGVYVSRWWKGSPANMYGLRAAHWITEVNGINTPNLERFLEATKNISDGIFVRLKVVNLQNRVSVITLKTDFHYWKTTILNWDYEELKWKWLEIPSTSDTDT